ncbi:MAG: biotin/lipoate A/B protein ligase family protein [Patescibacteria group bacterium]|nr:biotin/lipoate A/B protein ligase family protein [Patescibacteria group bacterium]
MKKIRLLKMGHKSAFDNMSIDESILLHSQKNNQSTLRFYGWKPTAISIGYFQNPLEEIDIDSCKNQNIDLIRRVTGGGAVFHDQEVTYSLISPIENKFIPLDIKESYYKISQGIIKGLEVFGIQAKFVPLNDIIANNKKISGNAQTRKKGILLQHGTILLDVDVDKMFTILKVPQEKLKDKIIKNVKERVTGINKLTGKEVSFDEAQTALIKGFEKALNLNYTIGSLTPSEIKLALELKKKKYTTHQWNYKR